MVVMAERTNNPPEPPAPIWVDKIGHALVESVTIHWGEEYSFIKLDLAFELAMKEMKLKATELRTITNGGN